LLYNEIQGALLQRVNLSQALIYLLDFVLFRQLVILSVSWSLEH